MVGAGLAVAAALALTPAGGFSGPQVHGRAAPFAAGAATVSISPPAVGHAPGTDAADCAHPPSYDGPRAFAYEEPYLDLKHDGHFDAGDPYVDCNGNGRWDGNLLGGGGNTPRFYDRVADAVSARAMVISNGRRTIAVEVLDQEGLFNVYQQRIRARVAADGYHLDGIFISATHDESAPDSLGLSGVDQFTSGVNDYWVDFMVARAARAIEAADRAMAPATVRYTEVLQPANVRQCWSSYPFIDDQHIPVLEAVNRRGRAIATLASVSQHAETLGFNGGPQANWLSADWVHFFRASLERSLGGVGIEMAGAVGSVESPEVFGSPVSRIPQTFIDESHPAGCRTLFTARGTHVAVGYTGETRAFGVDVASVIERALHGGAYVNSHTATLWGARTNICVPSDNALFALGAQIGIFAHRPAYNANCTKASPVAANGASSGQALRSDVAAFQIGDGAFLSLPGEVFPFTFLRGALRPADLPAPGPALPPWLMPYLHTPFRFIDGLAEDMLGYVFPAANAVGIPTASDLNPSDTDRFGCGHSDDSEAASGRAADIIGAAIVRLLRRHGGAPESILAGRYVLPGGARSRDPLGGPEVKCAGATRFHVTGRARAVALAGGRIVVPRRWMSLSGLPQRIPDRDTRGYIDARGRRVWLNVF